MTGRGASPRAPRPTRRQAGSGWRAGATPARRSGSCRRVPSPLLQPLTCGTQGRPGGGRRAALAAGSRPRLAGGGRPAPRRRLPARGFVGAVVLRAAARASRRPTKLHFPSAQPPPALAAPRRQTRESRVSPRWPRGEGGVWARAAAAAAAPERGKGQRLTAPRRRLGVWEPASARAARPLCQGPGSAAPPGPGFGPRGLGPGREWAGAASAGRGGVGEGVGGRRGGSGREGLGRGPAGRTRRPAQAQALASLAARGRGPSELLPRRATHVAPDVARRKGREGFAGRAMRMFLSESNHP